MRNGTSNQEAIMAHERDDIARIALLDQAKAELSDMLPDLWKSLYDGCIDKGFTEAQSMSLVIAWMRCNAKGDQ